MTTPRLVATDLDGTLVRSDGSLSAYTRQVLAELDRLDVPVVFVTGRPLRWTRVVFEHVGTHGLAVISNGALVWDVAGDRPVVERPVDPVVARDVVERLRGGIDGLRFSMETLEGWSMEPGYSRHLEDAHGNAPVRVAPIEELLDTGALKLLARRDGADPDQLVAEAVALVGDRVTVTHSSFPLLEISAPEVSKASTLELVCDRMGVDAADVVAFGDMPNDLPMLAWAGTSYAVGNAHPAVVDAADRRAPANDEDGVATVLAGVFGL